VVRDDEGHLCLAKLPSRNDQADVGAWEFVTNRLARRAGITVPDARLLRWGPTGSTVLFRRFDRDVRGNRLPFVSAMTLLGRRDGQPGASYLEVAELLMRDGAQRKVDAVQWFRRALFNVAVSNTDDHLRNHGLLLTPDGWALSPAFDMNPNPGGRHHVLALNEVDDIGDLGTVMAARTSYGVSDADADAALREVRQAVSHWRAEATLAGLSATECAAFASAFAAAERA
jgi:serine/threonine-protein kinase HipA